MSASRLGTAPGLGVGRGVRIAVDWRLWLARLQAAMVFAIGFALAFALLTSIEGFTGTDDYYHSRIAAETASQLHERGQLRLDFPWLPLTILNNAQFVDHHLLYHLYLSPWMFYGGVTGVKIAQSIVIGGIFVAFWSLLRSINVRWPLIWTLGLAAISAPFLYRMLMIRTQAAALLCILIGLHFLFERRYRWLIALAFGFTWLYNGFVLLPAIVALYCLAVWITQRRIEWKPLAFAVAGTGLGLVINPYFPQNIAFILDHLGEKIEIADSIRVGSEWYAYDTDTLLENSLGALLALATGIVAISFSRIRRDRIETTLLLVALLTLYMLFRSRRFIEYFPAFALLYGAAAWGRGGIQWSRYVPAWVNGRPFAYLHPMVLIVPLVILAWPTLQTVHADLQDAKDHRYMAGASAWLRENTEPGALVFQTDWDDFTNLFYYNTHNNYLIGLDPSYLQVANPPQWNQWVALTRGLVERPSVLIQETFGARYVVSDTNHDEFAQQADQDPNMHLVYRDDNSFIWQIDSVE